MAKKWQRKWRSKRSLTKWNHSLAKKWKKIKNKMANKKVKYYGYNI
jgi:hypothetical protein